MAQTTLLSSISRSDTFPVTKSIQAENNCGTLSLILTSSWTEQMLHELPNINISFYATSDIQIASIDVDMTTVNRSSVSTDSIDPYSIPIFNMPKSCILKITPLFDKYALSSHNQQVRDGYVDVFNTSSIGIVDTDIDNYSANLWTTPTQTFDISLIFDDTNIVSGGGSGGGQTITIDTQVTQNSTNPVQSGAIYNFVNSSVATNTANYISDNGQPFTSVQDLESYSGTVTNNDYAFVTGTDQDGNTYYDRYKATVSDGTVTWSKEYRLNNSSFTANQWDTINSGLTSSDKMVSGDGITITRSAYKDSLIPTMTSDTSPYGTVISSGHYQTRYAWLAFDGVDSGTWQSNSWSDATNILDGDPNSCYVGYEFEEQVTLNSFTISFSSDSQFQGIIQSRTNGTWTTLENITIPSTGYAKIERDFENTVDCDAIRFCVLSGKDYFTSDSYGGNVCEFNVSGSVAQSSVNLNPATSSSIGGVKIGSGLSVLSDGTLSTNVDSQFNSTSQNPVTNQFLTNFFTPMTQAQYDALSTKTLPLYFVYEM
jgi:hypothetical protein